MAGEQVNGPTPEPRRRRTCPPIDEVHRTADGLLVVRRTVLFEDQLGRPLDVRTTETRIRTTEDADS